MIPLNQQHEADVAVIGGGIAGLMAAIAAADKGASVVLLDKANTKRSGAGATGNDHFLCWIPEKHGDISVVYNEFMDSQNATSNDTPLVMRFLETSPKIVNMWNDWGINMKPTGDYHFEGHAYPGRPRIFLKYDGHNQKAVLTEQAKKRGVKILNHAPVLEMFRDADGVTGVLALDASGDEPSFITVKAKAVVAATGYVSRLFTTDPTPSQMFNTNMCPSGTGDSIAQAWRIGTYLVNMEKTYRHAGPRFLARCGKATWIGVYRYPDGRPVGPFITKPNVETGDMTSDVWSSAFTDLKLSGRGPAYMDCSGASKEDLEHMRWAMKCEGLTALLDYMDKEGIDPGKHAVEFGQYEANLVTNGIEIDINGESNVRGLFAAGDMMGNISGDIGAAAVYGWIAGHHAADYRTRPQSDISQENAEERMAFYSAIYERKVGASWQEANFALQQIMTEYADCGPHRVRSDTMLTAGIKYLGDLRKKIETQMFATDAHELMRAAEVVNLLDLGEALMISARERKESRGRHIRSDYTFTNPLLRDKFLRVWKDGDAIKTEWRDRLI
ncbi:FAD-binding protein [uncultured Mailhella sp.]|uniref:FAD-dependent oxidoreductase n=1 Tax=uncultured Mailhella sp. TaxID=1981031 RepID=UPI0025ECAD30|nr:FAD-binding protein [uncultured Mailhella sp.]